MYFYHLLKPFTRIHPWILKGSTFYMYRKYQQQQSRIAMVTSLRDFDSYHSQWIKSLYAKYPWRRFLNTIIQLFFPECDGVPHSWQDSRNWYTAEGSFHNTCLALWIHTVSKFATWLTKGVALFKGNSFSE